MARKDLKDRVAEVHGLLYIPAGLDGLYVVRSIGVKTCFVCVCMCVYVPLSCLCLVLFAVYKVAKLSNGIGV